MKIVITTNNFETQIYETENGWLCTINVLEDGEVSFGGTGDFAESPTKAIINSIHHLIHYWNDVVPLTSEIWAAYKTLK